MLSAGQVDDNLQHMQQMLVRDLAASDHRAKKTPKGMNAEEGERLPTCAFTASGNSA